MVAPPGVPRRPGGILPDVLQPESRVRLPTEDCKPGKISSESGHSAAHVSAIASGHERRSNDRGEVMSHFEEARLILAGSLRSGRLWLLQFFLNPILAGVFCAGVLLPAGKKLRRCLFFFLALGLVGGPAGVPPGGRQYLCG